jgi:cytochrome c
MDIFGQFTIPPTGNQLELLRYLLVMTYAIHLPFIGILSGATLLSLAFNARDRDIPNSSFARMAKDLMDMVLSNRAVVAVFGVLPLIVVCLIHGQWLAKAAPPTFPVLLVGAALVAFSFLPVTAYRSTLFGDGRNSFVNFMLGGVGLVTLLLGAYLMIGAITRFNDPERWFLEYNAFRQMLSFNVIWRYGVFLLSGLAFAGCGMLFFCFAWPGRKPIDDEGYSTFLKNFSAGVGLAATLLIPVILFFWLVTTPLIAITGTLYGIAVAIAGILFFVFLLLYLSILSPRPRSAALLFILFLVVFALTGVSDQLTLVNATREYSAALVEEGEEIRAQIEIDREAQRSESITIDVARGKEVFETVCMTCHRVDERLVGPPLNSVLPKYAGNIDELTSFILKPSKKNPEYPPMPAPGLPLADVKSVATYLIGSPAEEAPPEGTTPDSTKVME